MDSIFRIWKSHRQMLVRFLERYSLEQLNEIPAGFNNNLIWNIGHVIVVQQSLVYKSSNLDDYLSEELTNLYKMGSVPTGNTTQSEVDELKVLLVDLVEKTEADYKNQLFKTFNERTTRIGFHLGSLKDAFEFNNYHEALHLGYMMSIRKFVKDNTIKKI